MSFDPIDAARKAQFVQFAYNMFAAGGLQPPVDPGIAQAGYRFLYYLHADDFDETKFYGYVAQSVAEPGKYVLAVRGTETPQEWILDIAAIPVPFLPAPGRGFVALGFLSIFMTFRFVDTAGTSRTLQQLAITLAADGAVDELLIVGHSLGAALSTLAAAELAFVNPAGVRDAIQSYTFASPRVGLLGFASSFNDTVPLSYRIWNTLDIVPQVPTFPYIHVSGLGDAIVQTQHQLETLKITPACEHHLTSYLWLLDPVHFSLDTGCNLAAANAITAHMALAPGLTPAHHEAGAHAMRKALAGHA